jgi:hypothetical protein
VGFAVVKISDYFLTSAIITFVLIAGWNTSKILSKVPQLFPNAWQVIVLTLFFSKLFQECLPCMVKKDKYGLKNTRRRYVSNL